jgi:hypothetical protein
VGGACEQGGTTVLLKAAMAHANLFRSSQCSTLQATSQSEHHGEQNMCRTLARELLAYSCIRVSVSLLWKLIL